jgi:uncharacterized protein
LGFPRRRDRLQALRLLARRRVFEQNTSDVHAEANSRKMLGVPIAEVAWLTAAVLIAGVVTGFFAGLFGIGGGAIIVPVLYEIFRILDVPEQVRMQLCIGTSLAIIVPTTILSYWVHRAKGLVLWEVVRSWTLPTVAGVAAGAVIAAYAPPAVFKIAFALLASGIALRLLLDRESWRLGSDLPARLAMSGYGFAIGLAASLMGISGGSLVAMVLTLYNRPIHNSVATSAALGVPIGLAGSIGYVLAGLRYQALLPAFSLGFVSLLGVVVMAPISSFFAPFGARLAHALPRRKLEIGLGLYLLAVSLRFAVDMIMPFV